ncbi:MAG: hypothetical protein WBO92_01190 [Candidatus Moraniibacteriota bacterium]
MLDRRTTLKGSALGFSLVLLSLLLFSGITLLSVSVLERKASFATQKSAIAFQAADSGAERVLKRIYIDNSPAIAVASPNTDMTDPPYEDTSLGTLAGNLSATASGAGCSNGVISASNNNGTASPDYTFQVTFYTQSGAVISCSDAQWRDKVVRIRSEGFFQRTSRAIEVGIRARK